MKTVSMLLLTIMGMTLQAMNISERSIAPSRTMFVERTDFFKSILGMSESDFRNHYDWNKGQLTRFSPGEMRWIRAPQEERGAMPAHLLRWVQEHPARALIFEGDISFSTLKDLSNKCSAVKPLGKPQFIIRFHDPSHPHLTDIRSICENSQNYGAGIQVASTLFGMLEGGMFSWDAQVTNMLKGAAQGEEVSLLTAGATLARKYFLGCNPYLLEGLRAQLPYIFSTKGNAILPADTVLRYTIQPGDAEKVGIGLHEHVIVSFGESENCFKKPEAHDKQRMLFTPVDLTTGLVDRSRAQMVNLHFTSAYSLRGLDKSIADDPRIKVFCKMLLKSSYEGTLKSHYSAKYKSNKLFLTLMGASAFGNRIEWVGEALLQESIRTFIKQAGLEVTLIYRPDARKDHRNYRDDAEFLVNMLGIADQVNGTSFKNNLEITALVYGYTEALYEGNDRIASQSASELNELMRSVTASPAASAQAAASSDTDFLTAHLRARAASSNASLAARAAAADQVPYENTQLNLIENCVLENNVSMQYPFSGNTVETLKTLNNGSELAFLHLPRYNDAVLINYNRRTNQHMFVCPNVPGKALPRGLYYWKSQGKHTEIGNHSLKTVVSNRPRGKQFEFVSSLNRFVDVTDHSINYDESRSKPL